jgi:hypothetical protein
MRTAFSALLMLLMPVFVFLLYRSLRRNCTLRSDKQKCYLTKLSVAKVVQRRWRMKEYGTLVEWYWQENTEVLGEKPVTFLFFLWPDTPSGPRPPIVEVSRSHSDTPHSVGLLWTSDWPDTESYTWQQTTPPWDKHPCPRRDLNK